MATTRRSLSGIVAVIVLSFAVQARAQVTTRGDAVGKMLNLWFTEGSAAGLGGVFYENRDAGHSLFPAGEYPQLQTFTPPEEERKRAPTGLAVSVRPFVLFGNASMAAPAENGGSLPRFYFLEQNGFGFITNQYLNNNLFFYPCHQDHSPGWNGVGGWGDLYTTNTSCIVISQGSSFTDQPFMRAFVSAMAAIPAETQRTLTRSHLLMPAMQALFRRSSRLAKNEDDYFTGAAHPVVFRSGDIDEEGFVRLAHSLRPIAVPPVVLLQVTEESPAIKAGRDFFELPSLQSEKLSDTPCNIARIWRGSQFRRTMKVNARRSGSVTGQPLQFRWVLLQGDAQRVKITPSADGAEAELSVAWHPEMRAASGIASHRVDIGVFATAGITWSAPSFITFYMLPDEDRFYSADGRLEEICYEAGNPHTGLPAADDPRWLTLGHKLAQKDAPPGVRLLRDALARPALEALKNTADELAKQQQAWRDLSTDETKKTEAAAALQALRAETGKRITATGGPAPGIRAETERALLSLADRPELFIASQSEWKKLAAANSVKAAGDLADTVRRTLDFRVLMEVDGGELRLRESPEKLSAGDRAQLRTLHLTLLATALLPDFLERSNAPAWVDPRLTTPKAWRDIYHYDAKGALTGWTRITGGRDHEFTPAGELLPDGKEGRAVRMKFTRDAAGKHLLFAPE